MKNVKSRQFDSRLLEGGSGTAAGTGRKSGVLFLMVAAASAMLVCCLASCATKGQVAATVNGVEIPESKVTEQIEKTHQYYEDEDKWGEYLSNADKTPESLRSDVIDELVGDELTKQKASELGVEVSSDEVQAKIDEFKENFKDESAWQKALSRDGFTDETYFKEIEQAMLEERVEEHFRENLDLSEEDYMDMARSYASYFSGAKRVSQIVFDDDSAQDAGNGASGDDGASEDAKQAEEVASLISSGQLTFADAVSQYSTDEESAAIGGEVGWDKLNSFSTELTDALKDLEVGQVSEPIESDGRVYLLTVTEIFTAPEDTQEITSLSQLPEELQDAVKNYVESDEASTKYDEWIDELKQSADIVVNPMPEKLPYDIDMTSYSSDDAAEDDTAESTDADNATSQVTENE